jgi:hypothetical protein
VSTLYTRGLTDRLPDFMRSRVFYLHQNEPRETADVDVCHWFSSVSYFYRSEKSDVVRDGCVAFLESMSDD